MKVFAYRLCLLGAVGLALGAAAHIKSDKRDLRHDRRDRHHH